MTSEKAGGKVGNGAWYALVESATEGFAAYQKLRAEGFSVRIAPAPRGVQACCGMSIVFGDEAEVERARKYAAKEALAVTEFVRVESAPNPRRDRFC